MKRLAVFDFDHTLILGDSFWPYLTAASGRMATYVALAKAFVRFVERRAVRDKSESMRTFIKRELIVLLLQGRRRDQLQKAAELTRAWQKENPPVMQALRDHVGRGDTIVIASGGLDLYLPELLKDIPYQALICTDIGVENGVVTGEMINGNCVRLRKAERLGEWLSKHGPFDESFGYGNYPHDIPMMNLLKYRIIV